MFRLEGISQVAYFISSHHFDDWMSFVLLHILEQQQFDASRPYFKDFCIRAKILAL